MIFMIEAQIEYILKGASRRCAPRALASRRFGREAQRRYNDAIQSKLDRTVWARGGCSSWYKTRTGKITALWPGFMWQFARMMQTFDVDAYALEPRTETAAGSVTEQVGSTA